MADGGLAAHLGRAPRRDVRREPARHRPLHPDARLAAGDRARPGGDGARGSGRRGRVRAGRQRLARPGTGQPRARVPRDGHEAGTVDAARLDRLAEGPGVEPRQQHGRGAVPVPRRRPPRRPGPHRRAVPALSGRRTGDRAGPGRRGGRGGRGVRRSTAIRRATRDARSADDRLALDRRPRRLDRTHRGTGPRRWHGRHARRGLEQLGRRAGPDHDRRRAPRERPAPRDLDALDLVPERAPLRAGHRRLPVRRGGRLVPGRPGGRARSQRAHRVGRHERRPGRPGPVPRAGRPGRPDPLPVRWRIPAVRDEDRGDPGEGRCRARPPGGPAHGPRTDPQRRREAPRRCAAHEPALACHRGDRSHLRGDPRAQHGGFVRGVPREPVAVRHAEPELRLRRRRRPHRLPAARHGPDPRRRPDRPAAAPRRRHARVDGQHPVRRAALAARPRGGDDRDGEQCDRGRLVPVLRRRPVGSRASGRSGPRTGCWRAARTASRSTT